MFAAARWPVLRVWSACVPGWQRPRVPPRQVCELVREHIEVAGGMWEELADNLEAQLSIAVEEEAPHARSRKKPCVARCRYRYVPAD